MLTRLLSLSDKFWDECAPSRCFGVAEILYRRAAYLQGDARQKMLQCARAWKERGEERIG